MLKTILWVALGIVGLLVVAFACNPGLSSGGYTPYGYATPSPADRRNATEASISATAYVIVKGGRP